VYERLREIGFSAPIMEELRRIVEALEAAAENNLADEGAASPSARG
jgi:hypothetical protein